MVDQEITNSIRYEKVINRLRRKMRRYVDTGPTPGAAISVVTSKGSVWSEGFGYRDLAGPGEVDTQTIFQIGSTTKLFTGLAFMLAVQDGLVTLDDRLIDHWPEFRIRSRHGEKECEKMTFRHLLSHRAGLPREPRIGGNFGNDALYTFEEMVESLRDCWMVAPVNDRYYYSNVGFDTVAYALQRITGQDYPSWVKIKLAKPLSMETLRYGSFEALKEANVAVGTESGFHNCEFTASVDYGCGDVWIGNSDLAKVLVLLLNEGAYEGKEVLKKQLFHEMIKPHFTEDDGFNYGLGVDIYGGFTPRIFGHGGGSLGYASTFYWIPEYDFGVSVQTNMESYGSEKRNPHVLGRDAREALLQANGVTLRRPQPERFLQEKIHTPIVGDLSRLAGFYAGLWNSRVFIRYREGKLYWDVGPETEMTPKGTGFLLKSGNAVRFNFKSKKSRHPLSLTYVNPKWPAAKLNLFRVQPVEADPEARPIRPDLAERMTGIYKATYYGIEVTFNLAKVKNGQLYVHTLYGMTPAHALRPIDDVFFTPKGETVTFEDDELWVENCRGVKWKNPIAELRMLMEKNPKHRLLNKWPLDQIAAHLNELGRKQEAKEVRAIKRTLHSERK